MNLAFAYDENDNLVSQTDSRGIVTAYMYNDLDQQTNETITGPGGPFNRSFTYDQIGNRLTESDRRGIVSVWSHDKSNQMIRFTRAGQVQEQREYDGVGNLIFLTDANGNASSYEYNGRNELITENHPLTRVIAYTRNTMGDILNEDRPGDRDITRAYDVRRRLTSEINGESETTAFEYDEHNNQTARIRPNNARWEMDYDVANRLTQVTSPLSHETMYDYDSRDNRTSHTDARGRTTQLGYDDRSRQISKTWPDTEQMTMGYDANNNLTVTTEPNGNTGSYSYDALNRLISSTRSSAMDTITTQMTLDGNGNVTAVQEFNLGQMYNMAYQFDNLDRLTLMTDQFDNTLQYQYDANGNRTALLDHDQKTTRYSYDELNRLIQVQVPGMATFNTTYQSGTGLINTLSNTTGGSSAYGYDKADRIISIDHTQTGGPIASVGYDYDDNGNRTEQRLTNGDLTNNSEEITNYTYDTSDRLTQVTYPQQVNTYVIDAVGNRTQETIDNAVAMTTTVRDFTYNNRDQLIELNDSEAGLTIYTFDESGNRTSKTHGGILTQYFYSPRNRMIEINSDSGGGPQDVATYRYDHNGLRVEKTTGGNSKRYIHDDTAMMAETNVLGNTLARYHYSDRHRIAEDRGANGNVFFHDALGTVVAMVETQGTLSNRYDFDVWGNLVEQQGTSEQPFGFTGYQRDTESDLNYAQQRYYDSDIGIFVREDPLQGTRETPPSLHRYMYGFNNPTYFIDPTGKGNETTHFYRAFIAARAVGIDETNSLAFALGSQFPDEVNRFDAIHNSLQFSGDMTGTVWEQAVNMWKAAWAGETTQISDLDAEVRINNIINNISVHALSGIDATVIRDASTDFIQLEAQDILEVGVAAHPLADSFFHVQRGTLGKLIEIAHTPIIGHLLEWKNADRTFLFVGKADKSFNNLAMNLREYAQANNLSQLSDDQINASIFEANQRLNNIQKIIDQMNMGERKVFSYWKGESLAGKQVVSINQKQRKEYELLYRFSKELGLPSVQPEKFEAGETMGQLLDEFDHQTLHAILMLTNAVEKNTEYSKEYLIAELERQYSHRTERMQKWNYKRYLDHQQNGQIIREGDADTVNRADL